MEKISGIGYCFGGKHYNLEIYKTSEGKYYLMIDGFRGSSHDVNITASAELFWKSIKELELEYTETFWEPLHDFSR